MKRAILFFYFILIISASYAQSQDDQICLDCHSDNTLTKKRNGKDVSLFVDGKKFAGSVHEPISCTGCHSDVDPSNLPHNENLAKVDCSSCHDDKARTINTDVHHRLKVKNPPTCYSCHGNHNIKRIPKDNVAKAKEICSKCHTNKKVVAPYHGKVVSKNNCVSCHKKIDIHLTLPSSVHKNLECADCHNYISNNLAKHEMKIKVTQKADCYLCHGDIAREHRQSIHGKALKIGIDEAAKCWDCHGSHDVRKVKSEFSKVYPKNLKATCAKCHEDAELQKKFNVKKSSTEAEYLKSVHSKIAIYGKENTPSCSLCHGTHNIQKGKISPTSK